MSRRTARPAGLGPTSFLQDPVCVFLALPGRFQPLLAQRPITRPRLPWVRPPLQPAPPAPLENSRRLRVPDRRGRVRPARREPTLWRGRRSVRPVWLGHTRLGRGVGAVWYAVLALPGPFLGLWEQPWRGAVSPVQLVNSRLAQGPHFARIVQKETHNLLLLERDVCRVCQVHTALGRVMHPVSALPAQLERTPLHRPLRQSKRAPPARLESTALVLEKRQKPSACHALLGHSSLGVGQHWLEPVKPAQLEHTPLRLLLRRSKRASFAQLESTALVLGKQQ